MHIILRNIIYNQSTLIKILISMFYIIQSMRTSILTICIQYYYITICQEYQEYYICNIE